MSATSITPQLGFRQLHSAYRQAWKQFCAEVEVLQSLSLDKASTAELESARKRVSDAETLYRNKRNELAGYLIASSGRGREEARRFQLERLARRFWDEGGRRDGNAERDWYRAEALLRQSAR
ncbi:MAG: hypothetical protein ACRD45_01430 [Bryobacteraceae bacterium]